MRVSVTTQPGGLNPNEDWVAGTSSLAIVLDGLSTAGLDTGCRHGVPWYVAHLGGHLMATLAEPSRTLPDGLVIALEKVASLHPDCDLKNPGTPSSTVSILREEEGRFSYLVLADSPIVFEDGPSFKMVTDLSVEEFVRDLKAETERHTTGSHEHAVSVREMVEAQRQMRNVSGGYWVAAADPQAAEHAVTGDVPREGIRAVAVMSDGVSRLVTEYGMASWAEVFRTLRSDGTQELIETIRKVEATDPNGQRWPRYKVGDDAAVAFCLP